MPQVLLLPPDIQHQAAVEKEHDRTSAATKPQAAGKQQSAQIQKTQIAKTERLVYPSGPPLYLADNTRCYIRTMLDDKKLKSECIAHMDAGTFESPERSAAYHLTRHSPGMLIEEYYELARRCFESWAGLLVERLPSRFEAMQRFTDDQKWAKFVDGPLGTGSFSWTGRVLYFVPANGTGMQKNRRE